MNFQQLPEKADLDLISNYFYNKRVIKFCRADYMTDGVEDVEHFGPLQITFSDDTCLTFEIGSDGETIERILTTPIYFGKTPEEGMDYWNEIVLNDDLPWNEFVGKYIIKAELLANGHRGYEVFFGCRLTFSNNKTITYYNFYDNATVAFDGDAYLWDYIADTKSYWVENGGV